MAPQGAFFSEEPHMAWQDFHVQCPECTARCRLNLNLDTDDPTWATCGNGHKFVVAVETRAVVYARRDEGCSQCNT